MYLKETGVNTRNSIDSSQMLYWTSGFHKHGFSIFLDHKGSILSVVPVFSNQKYAIDYIYLVWDLYSLLNISINSLVYPSYIELVQQIHRIICWKFCMNSNHSITSLILWCHSLINNQFVFHEYINQSSHGAFMQ